jgi:uncharacterized membrane protein
MDEQNFGGQQSGWSSVGQGQQGTPGAPMYSSSGGFPPPGGSYPPPSGGYPPPPPPGGGYGGPGGYPPPPPPGQPPYGQPPYGAPPPVPPPPGQGLPPNTAAALSYITFIPAIIFLVLDPYKRSSFVRFHAWQCIVLTGVSVAISIIFMVLGFLPLHFIWLLMMLAHTAINLAIFIFWLIAIIKASKGERYHIPVVGGIAENFAGSV